MEKDSKAVLASPRWWTDMLLECSTVPFFQFHS